MTEWSNDILTRRFSPKQVAVLTGVAEDRQRLIASRHFDFRESIQPERGHRRWTWQGVQALAAFHEIMADMPNAERALAMVKGDEQTRVYDVDLRDDEEDILLTYFFDDPILGGAQVSTATGIAKVYGFGNHKARPSRTYTFNLASLQRRLFDRLSDLG